MRPALPGTPLVRGQARFTLASWAAGCHARSRFDAPRQVPQRRRLQVCLGHPRRGQRVVIPIAGLMSAGLRRGLPRPGASAARARRGPTHHAGGPVRFRSSRGGPRRVTIALSPGLWPRPAPSPGAAAGARAGRQALTECRGFRPSSTPWLGRPRGLQGAPRGGTGGPTP